MSGLVQNHKHLVMGLYTGKTYIWNHFCAWSFSHLLFASQDRKYHFTSYFLTANKTRDFVYNSVPLTSLRVEEER